MATAEPKKVASASRLARRLGLGDAVVIGLGSMIGAGVFAAFAPAAVAAGSGLLLGLLLAAVVAYANALSSAQLAALYPRSGGSYVYGRERLGHFWGFLAGWGFVVGKTASCAAMALTFGAYAAPSLARLLAIAAVVVLVAINYLGIEKTAAATRAAVVIVIATLGLTVAGALFGGAADAARITPLFDTGGVYGILRAGGILFFAFAGYARIATLGEEVRDPARVIPRAIPVAFGITLVVYAAVAVSALAAVGPRTLGHSSSPLAAAVDAGSLNALTPVVRAGAAVASLGVLLSLLAGVGRTAFAMAAEHDLPHWLAAVHRRNKVPHRAEIAIAAIVVAIVALADLRDAIGFSSFAVLVYYAVANASALTLTRSERRWPRWIPAIGLGGCLTLGFALPLSAVLVGGVVVGVGAVAFACLHRRDAA